MDSERRYSPTVHNSHGEARHLRQPGGIQGLHLACRADQSACADDEPQVHPVDHGILAEVGQPAGGGGPVRSELRLHMVPPHAEGLHSHDGGGDLPEALGGGRATEGVRTTDLTPRSHPPQ
jgi:hypothetical protein